MSYIRIWLHCVWGTQNRFPFLVQDKKTLLLEHIKNSAKGKEIYIDFINCVKDHVHMIISLNSEQCISKIMQQIKGESSFWINRMKLIHNFRWAEEYFAISISDYEINNVREYIKNQEEHHRIKTWAEEYEELIKECNFR